MVGSQHAVAGASQPNVDVLVDGIQQLLDATRTLRNAGMLDIQLPARLVQVCREVLDEADGATAARPRIASDPQGSVADKALRKLPLRRLLLQVINRGESVTVAEVVDRLTRLGVTADAAKVSNALGYQAERGELKREQRGLYTYPMDSSSTPVTVGESTHDDQRQQGDGRDHRATGARGQEDRRGQSAARERREAG